MSPAKEYRRNATQCVLVAEDALSPADQLILMQMAAAWLRLAEQAEKNSQADVS
jgi:hypothetical protein